jgi:predicted metal-binding protein
MTKHTLFVCQSCRVTPEHHGTEDHHQPEEKLDGELLLSQLLSLWEGWPRQSELQIQSVGCLCICDRPCAIAFVGTHKPTYLFADLDPSTCAADLLTASELYLDSKDGMVSASKLPTDLQPCRIARIPPVP